MLGPFLGGLDYWLTATKFLLAMHDTMLRVVECGG
jgi:hypothetical protein